MGKKRLNMQGVAVIFCFINSNIINKVINFIAKKNVSGFIIIKFNVSFEMLSRIP